MTDKDLLKTGEKARDCRQSLSRFEMNGLITVLTEKARSAGVI